MICSGSLIAVLNLIIESAPTRPKDKTMLDLMVITMIKIATAKSGKSEEVILLLATDKENLLYIQSIISEKIIVSAKPNKKSISDTALKLAEFN